MGQREQDMRKGQELLGTLFMCFPIKISYQGEHGADYYKKNPYSMREKTKSACACIEVHISIWNYRNNY